MAWKPLDQPIKVESQVLEGFDRTGFSVTEDTQLVWRGTPVDLDELRPGLTVSISFTGYVLEAYPAVLTEVCRVEVLDDDFR